MKNFDIFTHQGIVASHEWLVGLAQQQLGWAMWRAPASRKVTWLADIEGGRKVNAILEELPMGFLLHSFQSVAEESALFLKPDIMATALLEGSSRILLHVEKGHALLDTLPKAFHIDVQFENAFLKTSFDNVSDAFEEGVSQAIREIRRGNMQKVVLSRRKFQPYRKPLDISQLFVQLCNAYPNAFVALVFTPLYGWWIGASPEILISLDKHGIFRTMALAGTQPRSLYEEISQATWRQKEIEEQALVSRYIVNCFKKIRLREFEEIGPRTVEAGHLIHLRTDFIVDTVAVNFPELATVMLNLLHPTSAVCGMPKESALAFIRGHEKHERKLYSGFWGSVHVEGETQLFVNLRCAELLEEGVWLYAGAGITHDSEPAKEWAETEIKMNAIANFL